METNEEESNAGMTQVLAREERYLSDFLAFEKGLKSNEPPWLQQIRQQALSHFSKLGFPTARRGNEKWKYTSVVPIANATFEYPFDIYPDDVEAPVIRQLAPWDESWVNLVFVNGHYRQDLSTAPPRGNELRVANLAEAILADGDIAENHLARYAAVEDDAFTALNTAFLKDGTFVNIPDGDSLQSPLNLLFVSTDSARPTVSHPRSLVVVGRNSSLSIIESYVSIPHARCFTNAVTEIVVGEGAKVEHYKLLMDSPDSFHVGDYPGAPGPGQHLLLGVFFQGCRLGQERPPCPAGRTR